jgi:septal ring factor EnvC (AmiA/AmiB activator)
MFSSIKIAIVLMLLAGAGGGLMYVKSLQADLAVSEANNKELERGVETQKATIKQLKKDFEAINAAKKEISNQNLALQKEFTALDNKFNKINSSGKKRDLGKIALDSVRRSQTIQRIINNGSKEAVRCVEIAMGMLLTEKEKNATKKSEINSSCPNIANPKYIPY